MPGIYEFAPPYESLNNPLRATLSLELLAGTFWVLDVTASSISTDEYSIALERPWFVPLVVILPSAADSWQLREVLRSLPSLEPRCVLPTRALATPSQLRAILSQPPANPGSAVADYLQRRGLLTEKRLYNDFIQAIDGCRNSKTVQDIARSLYISRRTLGRRFLNGGLPKPSHVLQFGRLLRAVLKLHSDNRPIARIALDSGYPDGFTLSNQMVRLTGKRPSEVRRRLGWEWVLEAWLRRERI